MDKNEKDYYCDNKEAILVKDEWIYEKEKLKMKTPNWTLIETKVP